MTPMKLTQNRGFSLENATAELVAPRTQRDYVLEAPGTSGDLLIRKYRITARVILNIKQSLYVQCELRFSI